MSLPPVLIAMGSQSGLANARSASEICDALEIAWDARILSAHRTPDRMRVAALSAQNEGVQVIIAAAGCGRTCPV